MKQFDSTRPEFLPYGFTCEVWTPARMPRPDRHNEVEFNLLQDGTLTYLLGGHHTTIRAGELGIFWAAIPHQIVAFKGHAPYFVVTLPLCEFLELGVELNVVNRMLCGELLIDDADESDRLKFQQWETELRESADTCERAIKLEVQARLLRCSGRISNQPTASRNPAPSLSRADQLACYIAQNYQEPISSRSVAEAIGLHPNYAMNLFRKAFGTTMTTFITHHRISHAQRLLVTTGDAILGLAMASGFQSLSRFNEAFKAACGCSPRNYRRMHRTTTNINGRRQ